MPRHSEYRVIPITLETGETLPTLVRDGDWMPVEVATRWAVRRRRHECMESTLERDLRAVGDLYRWAEIVLNCDLDGMLGRSEVPTGRQLDALISHLRDSMPNGDPHRLSTVALKAASIRRFLVFAVDPRNQGAGGSRNLQRILEEKTTLSEVFRPLIKYASASQRISPIDPSELDRIRTIIEPERDDSKRLIVPFRFGPQNPFRPHTRLRNWLMCTTAHQIGPRRGELLKIRLDDIPKPDDPGLKIKRRPHDKADKRRRKPRVKTVERVLPLSHEIRLGLRMYLSSPLPMGRFPGRTPYLFVTDKGNALSIGAADDIVGVIARHAEVAHLSWHSFRHTWAEELADDLFDRYGEDQALTMLRQLGGWSPNSDTPFHYIQNAIGKHANEFLRQRNSRLYGDEDL